MIIDSQTACDLWNLKNGVYAPLTEFMDEQTALSVIERMQLPDGRPWGLPVLLPKKNEEVAVGDVVPLVYNGAEVGEIVIEGTFSFDLKIFSQKVFGTTSTEHPGVEKLFGDGNVFLWGKTKLTHDIFPASNVPILAPEQTKEIFKKKGWKTIVGFQGRNVPHRGHEHLHRKALEQHDGLFINPVLGKKKKGDYTDEALTHGYQAYVKHLPKNKTLLSFVPYVMRYAGPREALHHAIMRKNFGCTHFIVGRDHAGVGNWYGHYDAQELLNNLDIGIEIITFGAAYYCERCGKVVDNTLCNHPKTHHTHINATAIRDMVSKDQPTDARFVREDVIEAIKKTKRIFY